MVKSFDNGFALKNIAILGSTGSIGTQALEVIRQNPERFRAFLLTANSNAVLLIKQALEFNPEYVVITDKSKLDEVQCQNIASRLRAFGYFSMPYR